MSKLHGKKNNTKPNAGRKLISSKGKKSQAEKSNGVTLPPTSPPKDRPRKPKVDNSFGRDTSASNPSNIVKPSPTLEDRTLLLANRLLKNPQIWLETPNSQFGDRRPIDLIQGNEAIKVYNLLHAAELGLF